MLAYPLGLETVKSCGVMKRRYYTVELRGTLWFLSSLLSRAGACLCGIFFGGHVATSQAQSLANFADSPEISRRADFPGLWQNALVDPSVDGCPALAGDGLQAGEINLRRIGQRVETLRRRWKLCLAVVGGYFLIVLVHVDSFVMRGINNRHRLASSNCAALYMGKDVDIMLRLSVGDVHLRWYLDVRLLILLAAR